MKLNVGCGTFPMPDFINIDIRPLEGVDLVGDIETGLPFADESVDEIVAAHVLEHLFDVPYALREFHRVLKMTARAYIRVPLRQTWQPDHKQCFFAEWFDRNIGPEWRIEEQRVNETYDAKGQPYNELSVVLRKVKKSTTPRLKPGACP